MGAHPPSTRDGPAQALGVGRVEDREPHRLGQPPLGIGGELGVEGEAGGKREAGRLGGSPQDLQGRPGPLGIDVVGRHRRDTAPVVDPRVEQGAELVRQVRWGLEVDIVGQHQPGGGDGPQELVGGARGEGVHRGPRLGQEVLDDHLLHVPMAGVAGGDGGERRQPVGPALADPDQEAGGEGDGSHAGRFQGGQPALGRLVGRRPVGGQVRVEGLEHHPLAGGDRSEGGELGSVEGAGVGVGQQPGLLDHQAARMGQVVHRRRVAVLGQPGPSRRVAVLGALAQGEQGFVAPGVAPGAGDGHDVVEGQVGGLQPGGSLGERAVAAAVPAQHGEGDEHLGREGDPGAAGVASPPPGLGLQVGEPGVEECRGIERLGGSVGRTGR